MLLVVRGRGFNSAELDDGVPQDKANNRRHLIIGLIAFVYSLWLVYAADPKYVLLGALATFPSIIPYVWYRHHLGAADLHYLRVGCGGSHPGWGDHCRVGVSVGDDHPLGNSPRTGRPLRVFLPQCGRREHRPCPG